MAPRAAWGGNKLVDNFIDPVEGKQYLDDLAECTKKLVMSLLYTGKILGVTTFGTEPREYWLLFLVYHEIFSRFVFNFVFFRAFGKWTSEATLKEVAPQVWEVRLNNVVPFVWMLDDHDMYMTSKTKYASRVLKGAIHKDLHAQILLFLLCEEMFSTEEACYMYRKAYSCSVAGNLSLYWVARGLAREERAGQQVDYVKMKYVMDWLTSVLSSKTG